MVRKTKFEFRLGWFPSQWPLASHSEALWGLISIIRGGCHDDSVRTYCEHLENIKIWGVCVLLSRVLGQRKGYPSKLAIGIPEQGKSSHCHWSSRWGGSYPGNQPCPLTIDPSQVSQVLHTAQPSTLRPTEEPWKHYFKGQSLRRPMPSGEGGELKAKRKTLDLAPI